MDGIPSSISSSQPSQPRQPQQRVLQRGKRLPTKLTPAQRALSREAEASAVKAKAIERNMTREWRAGDVYSPHDLSPSEMKKWRKRFPPSTDAFDALSMNPLAQYKVGLCCVCCKGCTCNISCADNGLDAEFFNHVGVYHRDGSDTAPLRNRAQACEPEEDC